MKRFITILCLTINLALGSFGMGWSGDVQKGFEALTKGDYVTALKELTPLAEQGDVHAQQSDCENLKSGSWWNDSALKKKEHLSHLKSMILSGLPL